MSSHDLHHGSDSNSRHPSTGPYILQELLANVPLHAEEEDATENDAQISCVEYWSQYSPCSLSARHSVKEINVNLTSDQGGNLYIGTSSGGLLHYVSVPGSDEPGDASHVWIQASRRSLISPDASQGRGQDPSVQQILLLPNANKACILCQGSTTFYSLPELTPTLTQTKLPSCTWLGGLDENLDASGGDSRNGVVIMIFRKTKSLLVRVADRISTVRQVEFGGCLAAARRGDIACVADGTSYTLLNVVEQQRNPLFDISSSNKAEEEIGRPDFPTEARLVADPESKSEQTADNVGEADANSQSSDVAVATSSPDPQITEGFPPRQSSLAAVSGAAPPRQPSPASNSVETSASAKEEKRESAHRSGREKAQTPQVLRPKILSPTPNEFLLITGTAADEPSVGMFVNFEGDPVRGSLGFSSFPTSLCLDGDGIDPNLADNADETPSEGYILAVVNRPNATKGVQAVEIKRWDLDQADPANLVHWLEIGTGMPSPDEERGPADLVQQIGLRKVVDPLDCKLGDVVELLASSRLKLSATSAKRTEGNVEQDSEAARERSESQFISSLVKATSNTIAWAGNSIWTVFRNPLITRMESRLSAATVHNTNGLSVNRDAVESMIKEVRGLEPRNELDFFSNTYVHQKASMLLYMDLLSRAMSGLQIYDRDCRVTGEALSSGDLDPRVLLTLTPLLRDEIVEGSGGIWIRRGLISVLDDFLGRAEVQKDFRTYGDSGTRLLELLKSYLMHCRERKGYGSVADGKETSAAVDAALVHLMLVLDSKSAPGRGAKGSLRYELYSVIRQGVDSFDRVRQLLEDFNRLYVLSLLYQTRKMPREVLATWKRIIEGDTDAGAELIEGESQIRRYLTQVHDAELVKEYASWLARRNPNLGVRVFTDGDSKVKFTPKEAVDILKARAPGAVKVFLEHLVFEKNLAIYATDLISYYLEAVITRLDSSPSTQNFLLASYREYRALRPPKPTYSQFAADKDSSEWWLNRLRLLQLLGGSHGAASQYDVPGMLAQVRRYENELVPEMIVLAGKQGQHQNAIHLLVQGLGDYDTAVSYCLRGGESTYSPTAGTMPKASVPEREQQEKLFGYLLSEFLAIDDLSDRVMQTSELLDRFAGWFDPISVLDRIPDSWSVDLLSGFIETVMRGLITERNHTAVVRALLNADNLNANADLVEKLDLFRPRLELGEGETT